MTQDIKIGDTVEYTNENGVFFGRKTIIGKDSWYGYDLRYFITPTDTPWYSVKESCLRKIEKNINNGEG